MALASSVVQFFHQVHRRNTRVHLQFRVVASRLHCVRFYEFYGKVDLLISSTSTRFLPKKFSDPHSSSGFSNLLAMTIGNRRSNRSLWTKEE